MRLIAFALTAECISAFRFGKRLALGSLGGRFNARYAPYASHLMQSPSTSNADFDLIVVGAGNGACGFLSKYLDVADPNAKVLVLEQGEDYFYTSDLTHQYGWTKAFAQGDIFRLHNARTSKGTPIISGRACTMGGGGSINYTMIHESSKWLAKIIGYNVKYWDAMKKDLNKRFKRADPTVRETAITQHIVGELVAMGFQEPKKQDMIENIPSYGEQDMQLIQFPTQFDFFGQRTNSGVSLVNWEDPRIHLKTRVSVQELVLTADSGDRVRCTSLTLKGNDKQALETVSLSMNGRVVLCAGAATPRILMPHREALRNPVIGSCVSDHFAMPLGIYIPQKDLEVSPKDIYAPVFAVLNWKSDHGGSDVLVSFDFFAGRLETLLYLTSHLFLAFLPNFIKSNMLRYPSLFSVVKNLVRITVSIINLFITRFLGEIDFITAIIKFNPAREGKYDDDPEKGIVLGWFDDDQDKMVAKETLKQHLGVVSQLGHAPPGWLQWIYSSVTKIPFHPSQVDAYVGHYSENSLLSEQHMAGGCIFGDALDTGEADRTKTGLVHGSSNIHVADLSATHLPRVSPQMTAYLIGFHVASRLYGKA